MAKVSVSVDVPLSPAQAWQHASDLSRYSEWLSIHRVWRSTPPKTIDEGTVVESIVEVRGLRNRITWTIVNFRPPESLTLDGVGTNGVKVKMIGRVRPGAAARSDRVGPAGESAVVSMGIHLGGPALFGPIGLIVAAGLRSDIRASLDRFVTVFAPA
ncbi:MAG: SRPBCC family protein [Mycobacterium sp.]